MIKSDEQHKAISIHAPREGGDCVKSVKSRLTRDFNPRPPRGGRPPLEVVNLYFDEFQSTPPARGATGEPLEVWYALAGISIHAPREGGDLASAYACALDIPFQSTPPARWATLQRL